MSKQVAIAVHLVMLILGAANQYLIPAFMQLNPMQLAALTGFLAVVFQGLQMVIGVQAYDLTPSGAKAGQSTVVTTMTPAGDVKGVTEIHQEPTK
jgi:hypothetical protein